MTDFTTAQALAALEELQRIAAQSFPAAAAEDGLVVRSFILRSRERADALLGRLELVLPLAGAYAGAAGRPTLHSIVADARRAASDARSAARQA